MVGGIDDSISVGNRVGMFEGPDVGVSVREALGLEEGASLVGNAEGNLVGTKVGDTEG